MSYQQGLSALLVSLAVLAVPLRSEAAAPTVKARPPLAVFFSAEAATMRLLGDAGTHSSWSFGGHLRQGLSYGPIVGWVRIGGDAWLTHQPGPPLQRGLRAFTTGVGFGVQHGFGVLRLTGFGEYAILNVSGNPLYDTLGRRTMFHSVGGGGAVAFTGMSPLFGEFRVAAHHWFGTERPTQSLQFVFSIGVEARIRR